MDRVSKGISGGFVWAEHLARPFLVFFGGIGIVEDCLLFFTPVFEFGFSLSSFSGFSIAGFFLCFAEELEGFSDEALWNRS